MSTYTIGEVAERSGFSASALRYYESIGLVTPATRTEAGYRVYDDRTLARLAFISRAKRLGCTLPETTDLVAVWEAENCGPAQRRFHELVTAKIGDAQRQVDELTALTAQLRAAAAQLAGPASDGPCGPDCACSGGAAATVAGNETVPVALAAKPADAPIACSLDGAAKPDRLADWRAALGRAVVRTTTSDGALRVEFADTRQVGELAELVAAEQQCCAFFSFAITVDHRGLGLEVQAPAGAAGIVDSRFGQST